MVTEGHRLGRLQVGETGKDGIGFFLGPVEQTADQRRKASVHAVDGVPHPEPEIGRDLVIARAPGVQPPGGFADDFLEPSLDVHMDVFELSPECEKTLSDLFGYRGEAVVDGRRVRLRDDPLLGQHPGMGARAVDILLRHALVDVDRGVDRLHHRIGSAGEATAPHAVSAVVGGPQARGNTMVWTNLHDQQL